MKNGFRQWLALPLLALVLFTSCSRHDDKTNDCITRYFTDAADTMQTTKLDSIKALFAKNNLPTNILQFTALSYGYTAQPPFARIATIGATANLFYNGLPLFGLQYAFFFDSNGVYIPAYYTDKYQYLTGPDSTGHQTLENLRQIFLNNYKQCTIEGGLVHSTPSHPTAPYQDSCLAAELGYNYDYNNPGQLLKVWKVSSAANHFYPAVFVNDANGQATPEILSIP